MELFLAICAIEIAYLCNWQSLYLECHSKLVVKALHMVFLGVMLLDEGIICIFVVG
jgi:hypothetical protein